MPRASLAGALQHFCEAEKEDSMATDTRARDEAEVERTDENAPVRKGDILGLSDAPPEVEIPQASKDRGGSPEGIDVRDRITGIDELTHGSGATGIDMGGGGEGTDVSSDSTRPRTSSAGRKS
jgi:hypothetical protein